MQRRTSERSSQEVNPKQVFPAQLAGIFGNAAPLCVVSGVTVAGTDLQTLLHYYSLLWNLLRNATNATSAGENVLPGSHHSGKWWL